MLHHGIKDSIVALFYLGIIAFIIILAIFLDTISPHEIFIISILAIFFGGYVFLYMLGAFLNLAYTGGEFKAGFDFKTIRGMLKKIGLFRVSIIYIFGLIAEYLILTSLLHVGIFAENSILSFLVNLLLTPFVVIFTERLFALSSL